MKDIDIVFSGMGVVTAAGVNADAQWKALDGAQPEKYDLQCFQPALYMSDRRMLKAVSDVDAYGLVAVETMLKDAEYEKGSYDAWRTGLYVGAPPSSPWDNQNYFDAIRETRGADGNASVQRFGETCMNARPTTLLLGLPNNVLCYGAILLDAKGPNSNYTSGETSGSMAVMNAANRIRYDRLDCAVAGGYTGHNEKVVMGMLRQNDLLKDGTTGSSIDPYDGTKPGTVVADGSVFYMLERRSEAEKRGRKALATYIHGAIGSETKGGFAQVRRPPVLADTINRCLREADVSAQEVGLVFTAGTGIPSLDCAELQAIDLAFESTVEKPAVGTISRAFGNLMEAGGLLEIGMAPRIYEFGKLPESMTIAGGYSRCVNRAKPYSLILRSTIFSDFSVMLIRNP